VSRRPFFEDVLPFQGYILRSLPFQVTGPATRNVAAKGPYPVDLRPNLNHLDFRSKFGYLPPPIVSPTSDGIC